MTNNELVQGWGAVDNEDDKAGRSGDFERPEFLKISLGDTKVRVLDMFPFSYKEYYIPQANEGKGASIGYFGKEDLLEKANSAFMAKVFKEADAKGLKDKARKDFLRDEGYKKTPFGKVKEKHIIHVLDRATGEVKLMDKGNAIFGALKKLALNPEYGDLRNYDVTITMTDTKGKGQFTDIEYSVTPARQNTPLTEAEIKLYEEKKIDLAKFKTPNYTPQQALQIAKGASFMTVLGNDSDSKEEVEEKSDTDMLPKEEPKEEPKKEAEPVEVEKGEELTPEELADLEF